jgi:hypothetical protein
MRLFTLFIALIFTSLNLINAETTTVKVATGKTYSNLAWYDLTDDAISTKPLNGWDFAVLVPGQNAALIINSGAGCKLWEVVGKTVDDFGNSIDTNGLTTNINLFKEWYNSDDTWAVGAFNCNLNGFDGDGDFGWGTYNMTTHVISGTKLFIIKSSTGKYYQIRIEDLLSGEFYFSFANLDGSESKTESISKKAFPGKTFGYYNLATKEKHDLDPPGWSLLFGKYMAQVDNGQGGTSPYMVNGIRHNYNWWAVKVSGQNPATVQTPGAEEFSGRITTIGHEWKKLNANFEWEIPTDLCYFIMSEDGLAWKLVFKAFSGSSTGETTFEKTPVFVNSIKDNDGNSVGFFAITPNVIENNGSFDIAYGSKSDAFPTEISIYDLNGNKVYMQNFDNSTFNAVSVTPKLTSGMYFVVMNIAGLTSSQKLIVK